MDRRSHDDVVRGRHPLVGAVLSIVLTVTVAFALGLLVMALTSSGGFPFVAAA